MSMHFGTLMGLLWILKFSFLPLGFTYPMLQLMFLLLTAMVPIIGYMWSLKYRDVYCFGNITFRHAFIYNMMMYSFAILLTAVAHLIYFAKIDNGYLIEKYTEVLQSAKASLPAEMIAEADKINEAFELLASMSAREITFELMSQNFFYCTLIAIPASFILRKSK